MLHRLSVPPSTVWTPTSFRSKSTAPPSSAIRTTSTPWACPTPPAAKAATASAPNNCGSDIPPTQITINLAPADINTEGSGFDPPLALGLVGAYGGLTKKEILDCLFFGELSPDGGLRSVRGALHIAIEARGRKISRMVVPGANAKEAAMVGGV
jgi:predicted ATPase with chaperone activity